MTRWLVWFLLRRTCRSFFTSSTSQRRRCLTSTGRKDVLAATMAAQYTCSHSGFEAAASNNRWRSSAVNAQADDIKVKLDDVLESLETKYPDKLKGLLPRIYAGSNLDAVSVRGLINLFSKHIFEADHGGDDLIGRVYEYFIGEFASSEGKRGGEYFTPVSIVKTLVAMLEPEKGVVFDPCCG